MREQIIQKIEEFISRKLGNIQILYSEIKGGYRNLSIPVLIENKSKLNIILYKTTEKTLENIRQIHQIARVLHHHKFPCRYSIDNKIYCTSNKSRKYYFAIYNYIEGNTKDWQMFTKRDLKHVGRLMAKMHMIFKREGEQSLAPAKLSSSKSLPSSQTCFKRGGELRCGISNIEDISTRNIRLINLMRKYFNDQNVLGAIQEKLKLKIDNEKLQELFNFVSDYRPLQSPLVTASPRKQVTILHMDFVRGNIIFKDKKINGIIDFEKVAVGDIHFDLARTFAFFLVDLSHKTYQEIYEQFILKGYFSNIQIEIDHDLFENLINFYLIYDFYKFLKHNPYEYLEENYHYRRTREILIQAS